MTITDGSNESQPTPASSGSHAEANKPITIMLPDDVLKKLKIVAIVRETSVSELMADAAMAVVKRELKKVLGKLEL